MQNIRVVNGGLFCEELAKVHAVNMLINFTSEYNAKGSHDTCKIPCGSLSNAQNYLRIKTKK